MTTHLCKEILKVNYKMFLKLVSIFVFITMVNARTVILGLTSDFSGVRKVHEMPVLREAFPFRSRVEDVYIYNKVGVSQAIRGIAMKDLDNGLGEPVILAGGIGFQFVHIAITSERGSRIRFLIEVYA